MVSEDGAISEGLKQDSGGAMMGFEAVFSHDGVYWCRAYVYEYTDGVHLCLLEGDRQL